MGTGGGVSDASSVCVASPEPPTARSAPSRPRLRKAWEFRWDDDESAASSESAKLPMAQEAAVSARSPKRMRRAWEFSWDDNDTGAGEASQPVTAAGVPEIASRDAPDSAARSDDLPLCSDSAETSSPTTEERSDMPSSEEAVAAVVAAPDDDTRPREADVSAQQPSARPRRRRRKERAAERTVSVGGEHQQAPPEPSDDMVAEIDLSEVMARLAALGSGEQGSVVPLSGSSGSARRERRLSWVKPRRCVRPVQVERIPAAKRQQRPEAGEGVAGDAELWTDPLVSRAMQVARLLREGETDARRMNELRRVLREIRHEVADVEARAFVRRVPRELPAFFQAYDPRTRTA